VILILERTSGLQKKTIFTFENSTMKNILILCIIAILPIFLKGQAQDSFALIYDEIVIAENRIDLPFNDNSRNIEIVTKDQIQILKASSINELLQVVSGVDIRQRGIQGVQGDISIRGGTFEQTLILINGIKMIDPQTGHHMLNIPLSVNDIERIEVLKGPSSRIYGVNAFAGAVNIVTKTRDEIGADLAIEFGENALINANASISLPVGDYKQTLSLSRQSSDGYRFNSDYTIQNAFYQSSLTIGNGDLKLFGGYVDRKFGANGFYGNESFIDQYEEVKTGFVSLQLTQKAGAWKITPRLSWRNNKDNWQFRRLDPEFFQNFHTSNVYNAEINSSMTHNLGVLGVGIEYAVFDLKSSNLQDHDRTQSSVHIENRFLFLDEKLDVTPGLLLMNISDFGTEVFPGLDIGYQINNQVKLFANMGWTTRIPTYTDLYYIDSGNIGNPNLQEEKAFSSELGLKYKTQNIYIQSSIFSRNATDQIDWFRLTDMDKWMPDNFSKATYAGFEVSGQIDYSKTMNLLNALRLSYTYLNARFEDNEFAFSRNQLENLRHQIVFNPSFNLGPVVLSTVLKYNDRVSLDDYMTIDANFSYKILKHEVYVRASNITDEIYKETNLVEMPGRWISGGVKVRL